MMKAKFRDSLRSKTNVAMRNEALTKLLYHNVCCLIQSQYESGVEATFWGKDKATPEPQVVSTDLVEAWAWI